MPRTFRDHRNRPVLVKPQPDIVSEQQFAKALRPNTPESAKRTEDSGNQPYKMSINLNVLNHLGIGLYSNFPAVLSEIVANSWDADASAVHIKLDRAAQTITISDDGMGMNLQDINGKFLNVGYQKRVKEPGLTKKLRAPMGRKGIGKLSVFSIADIVEVHSVKDGERHAFRMDANKIKSKIEADEDAPYYPEKLDVGSIDFEQGTSIVLHDLKHNVTSTGAYLRKRLARRFSIIGAERSFRVFIDGIEVTPRDREYYDRIEFLWYAGKVNPGFFQKEDNGSVELRGNVRNTFEVSGDVDQKLGYTINGWIGTVDEQRSIDEENNAIVIFAHGKLVQEDILKDLKEGGIYTKYIVGEINADYLDDGADDIVTSARQSLKEDDIRYEKLKEHIHSIIKTIGSEWTDLRKGLGVERALQQPVLKEWYEQQTGDNKKYAATLFGKIESLRLPDPQARKELYKASLLAFETLALKNQLSILDSIETPGDLDLITKVFQGIDDLEAVHYFQIIKGRIEVVKEFERILDDDARERVIQRHIYDHLWLLDPSWERAAFDERIEQGVATEWRKLDAKLTPDEQKARLDIRYRTAAGKYIIIELKRYTRKVSVYELLEQINKYEDALRKVVKTLRPNDNDPVIETICLLGSPPTPVEEDDRNRAYLRDANARYMTYDELISQTKKSYEEYLTKERKVSKLIATIESLDAAFDLPH